MEWSKYVGYGPAVDEEWDRISDSELPASTTKRILS